MEEMNRKGEVLSHSKYPDFLELWFKTHMMYMSDLEANHEALRKIEHYFFATGDEVETLEKEILESITQYYQKLLESRRLMAITTLQGFRDFVKDANVSTVWELDAFLKKRQKHQEELVFTLLDEVDATKRKMERKKLRKGGTFTCDLSNEYVIEYTKSEKPHKSQKKYSSV